MPSRRKTLEELLDDLDTEKQSLENEGLPMLTEEYNRHEAARNFLRRNSALDENDERVVEKRRIMNQFKESYNKILKMKNLERRIARLRVSQNNISTTQENTQVIVKKCASCQRKEYDTIHSEYNLSYHSIPVSEIKKFATFKYVKTDNCSGQQRFVLCTQLTQHKQ